MGASRFSGDVRGRLVGLPHRAHLPFRVCAANWPSTLRMAAARLCRRSMYRRACSSLAGSRHCVQLSAHAHIAAWEAAERSVVLIAGRCAAHTGRGRDANIDFSVVARLADIKIHSSCHGETSPSQAILPCNARCRAHAHDNHLTTLFRTSSPSANGAGAAPPPPDTGQHKGPTSSQ